MCLAALLNLDSSLTSRRSMTCYGALSTDNPRKCKIPYTTADAAALTFSDSSVPRIGSAMTSSQAARTRGRSPFPSEPKTTTTLPR